LRRKTTEPVQMHTELRAEELAWFFLFPKGRNGLHEPSQLYPITPLDYCQARIIPDNTNLFYKYSINIFQGIFEYSILSNMKKTTYESS